MKFLCRDVFIYSSGGTNDCDEFCLVFTTSWPLKSRLVSVECKHLGNGGEMLWDKLNIIMHKASVQKQEV